MSLPKWSPHVQGLSLSGLELWLIDKTAFELSYLRNLEPVEPWNKSIHYGLLIQAGIEGYIKTRQPRGAAKFIQTEFEKQAAEHSELDDIAWWTKLAQHQVSTWISLYGPDIQKYGITESENNHKVTVELPSGRTLLINGFIDGEGDDILMENKCRGEWSEEAIAKEIDLNLQVNMYLLMFKAKHGKLPGRMWYQHIRRPGGWGYSGPRRKARESDDDYCKRLAEAIDTDRDYHFFRYWILPDEDRHNRFLYACLYPMLEAFLDWYEYMDNPAGTHNRYHWITPYGLYNPFTEGTQERFRTWRLTGSTLGLRPKVKRR